MRTPEVPTGTQLPRLILSAALTARQGSAVAADVQLTMLTTMDLVESYVTDWAGPDAFIRGMNVKLGRPAHAGDTITFTGVVVGVTTEIVTVEVCARLAEGVHATGTVRVSW
ncbi:acyl dehydratase [Herbidospora galbida]|uniref:Acyl dehydratase n=1 Tax=Herbidospora galbida TaxID=2575442 RepID=A0A4U3MJ66_9ACTN|nr:acyl dehydratase [Herbidospora galbida]TKK88602.1 acyl dehydratase [Herbidospora galbida]